jgi:hypothetical protein
MRHTHLLLRVHLVRLKSPKLASEMSPAASNEASWIFACQVHASHPTAAACPFQIFRPSHISSPEAIPKPVCHVGAYNQTNYSAHLLLRVHLVRLKSPKLASEMSPAARMAFSSTPSMVARCGSSRFACSPAAEPKNLQDVKRSCRTHTLWWLGLPAALQQTTTFAGHLRKVQLPCVGLSAACANAEVLDSGDVQVQS